MIDKSTAIEHVCTRMKRLSPGQGLDLRTFKRDRSVQLLVLENDLLEVRVDGFEKNIFSISDKDLRKTLKKLLKQEFPRSNKVRIYALDS